MEVNYLLNSLIKLLFIQTTLNALNVCSAPIARPSPNPSFAQAAIATLTIIQAGIVGYALQHESDLEPLISKSTNL